MAARTTDHSVHMMTIAVIHGSPLGMARTPASTAAMLRLPIPRHITLRSLCFRPKPKRYVIRPITSMKRVMEARAKLPAVSSICRA
jgi:hypothetical protein